MKINKNLTQKRLKELLYYDRYCQTESSAYQYLKENNVFTKEWQQHNK